MPVRTDIHGLVYGEGLTRRERHPLSLFVFSSRVSMHVSRQSGTYPYVCNPESFGVVYRFLCVRELSGGNLVSFYERVLVPASVYVYIHLCTYAACTCKYVLVYAGVCIRPARDCISMTE